MLSPLLGKDEHLYCCFQCLAVKFYMTTITYCQNHCHMHAHPPSKSARSVPIRIILRTRFETRCRSWGACRCLHRPQFWFRRLTLLASASCRGDGPRPGQDGKREDAVSHAGVALPTHSARRPDAHSFCTDPSARKIKSTEKISEKRVPAHNISVREPSGVRSGCLCARPFGAWRCLCLFGSDLVVRNWLGASRAASLRGRISNARPCDAPRARHSSGKKRSF